MPYIKTANLWSFYVEGRDYRLLPHGDSRDVLAKVTESDLPMLEACAQIAGESLPSNIRRRTWVVKHAADIKKLGVSEDDAYAAWIDGCRDKLTLKLQKLCMDELYDEYVEDDDDEDGDDDSDDDDDENED